MIWFKKKQISKEPLPEKSGAFNRLKKGLLKTRTQLGERLGTLLFGQKKIDAAILDELEMLLLSADIGMNTTRFLIDSLSAELARNQLMDGEAVYKLLRQKLCDLLTPPEEPELKAEPLHVILVAGVNGAGKTTTIGKLAARFKADGKKVMLAAGDTFRAAAIEQLQVWGERNQVPVIAQHTGADSASVVFDAFSAAKARSIDVLIADTAGRLHTQYHLMDELRKVKRVLEKIDAKAPHEILLVLDASIGQNALSQAREFHEALGVTGIVMTKLDGTAKGGIVFAIAHELGIPLRYMGVGEGVDDLQSFDAEQFVDAILNDNTTNTGQ